MHPPKRDIHPAYRIGSNLFIVTIFDKAGTLPLTTPNEITKKRIRSVFFKMLNDLTSLIVIMAQEFWLNGLIWWLWRYRFLNWRKTDVDIYPQTEMSFFWRALNIRNCGQPYRSIAQASKAITKRLSRYTSSNYFD